MKTARLVVPISLLAVVEIDIPEQGDKDSSGKPLVMTARFGIDDGGAVDLHAPLVRTDDMENRRPFAGEREQATVAAFAVAATLMRAVQEHQDRRGDLLNTKNPEVLPDAHTWGPPKGQA